MKIIGGKKFERDVAEKTVAWCLSHFNINDVDIRMNIRRDESWGYCEEDGDNKFTIVVDPEQTLRDFVASIVHEMVHLNQYITGEYRGTGEAEAKYFQYRLTDKLWNEGAL